MPPRSKRYTVVPLEVLDTKSSRAQISNPWSTIEIKAPTQLLPFQQAIQAKSEIYATLDKLLLPPLSDLVVSYLSKRKQERSKKCPHTLCEHIFACCLCGGDNVNELCAACRAERDS